MHCQRSLSSFFRLVGFAHAARPLAGGSPLAVLGRNRSLQTTLASGAFGQTDPMNQSLELRKKLPHSTVRELRRRVVELKARVRPNPSIEPTSTGWARYALYSFSASRAHPVPAAHVKR
jgi:hypothetical protein